MKKNKYYHLITLIFIVLLSNVSHATETSTWNKSQNKEENIDHSDWQTILDEYIIEKKQSSSNYPTNFFSYSKVSSEHQKILTKYINDMEKIEPRVYSKDEQFAYWVNLYNALTVNIILENYPVKSITKLGTVFSFGPWDEEATTISGEELTLNDIEHKILRPIWNDPRIHYAVNCASFSCPNLSKTAYTKDNTEQQLEYSAKAYINNNRGVKITDEDLELSEIYKWYKEDFGTSEENILKHINKYADNDLKDFLKKFDGDIDYEYNWNLNELQ